MPVEGMVTPRAPLPPLFPAWPVGSHLHVHVQAVVEVPEPEEVGEAQGEVEAPQTFVPQGQGVQDVTVVLVTPAGGMAAPCEPPWGHLTLILPLPAGDRDSPTVPQGTSSPLRHPPAPGQPHPPRPCITCGSSRCQRPGGS